MSSMALLMSVSGVLDTMAWSISVKKLQRIFMSNLRMIARLGDIEEFEGVSEGHLDVDKLVCKPHSFDTI